MKASESSIFKIGGLQCDVNGCDYIDTTINADDYKDLIGIVFNKHNKNSELSKYIEENYPEFLV